MVIERTAPIRLTHTGDVPARVVATVEVEVSIVGVVNEIGVIIEQRTALAARGRRHDERRDCNPNSTHRELTFHFQTSSTHRLADMIGLNGFNDGNRHESQIPGEQRCSFPAMITRRAATAFNHDSIH